MNKQLLHRLLNVTRIDGAVGYTLVNRAWMLGSNALTMVLIVHFLTGVQQGLYVTFLALLGGHTVFDLGVSFTLTQWIARERAAIEGVASQCRLSGGPARARVGYLFKAAGLQIALLSMLFLALTLSCGVALFANDPGVTTSSWLLPWILVTIATALRLVLLCVEGVLEGLGMVRVVSEVRLRGLVMGTLSLWVVLVAGGGLWGLAACTILNVLVAALMYGRRYGALFRDLARAARTPCTLNWRHEVWPSQWKYAFTILTGFLVANLFNPVVYYFHGAETAGRFGIGMSIAQAVAGFMSVWLNCKVPTIAALTAERRFDLLRALFMATKRSAAIVAVLAGTCALVLLRVLVLIDPALAERLPPESTLLVLMMGAALQQYILTVAVFARSQRLEPLLTPSLMVAVITLGLLSWLVPLYGAAGAAVSYMLPAVLVSVPFTWLINRRVLAIMACSDPLNTSRAG